MPEIPVLGCLCSALRRIFFWRGGGRLGILDSQEKRNWKNKVEGFLSLTSTEDWIFSVAERGIHFQPILQKVQSSDLKCQALIQESGLSNDKLTCLLHRLCIAENNKQ